LLGGDGRGIAEGEAAVLDARPLDVPGSLVGQAEEGADVRGALGELREEGAPIGIAGRFSGGGLSAPA